MISERKLAANRLNAKKSCGPRTAAGKCRVSRNALRHGLAAVKHLDVRLPRNIGLMAQALCGSDLNHLLLQQALLIADNRLLLQRIRGERVGLIERLRDRDAFALAQSSFRHLKARVKARSAESDMAFAELKQRQARFNQLSREEQYRLLDEYTREFERLESQAAPIIEERDDADTMEAGPSRHRATSPVRTASVVALPPRASQFHNDQIRRAGKLRRIMQDRKRQAD